jgi:peptide/nickel transport system substrate-binding protein/oligopeptide transport system substrate-binding protein
LTPTRPAAAGLLTVLSLVAVAAFVVGTPGCAGDADEPGTLHLALETSPNQLDPALVVDVAEGEICSQLFQGLVRFDVRGQIVPALANGWVIGNGGTQYVFRLQRNMRFANGRRVDASDVLFSFHRLLAPDSRSSRRWVLDRISGARQFAAGEGAAIAGLSAPDDSTVTITLDEPFGPFLSLLALPAAMVVPREELTAAPAGVSSSNSGFKTFGALPVGSGPWRLKEWERGDYLLLEPNSYHPSGPGAIKAIRFRIIPEAFTRVAEFESGSLDVLKVPLAEYDRFLNSDRYRPLVQERAELRVYYIGLNNTRPPLDNPSVRRALNMAVDVDRLIEVLTSGTAVRSSGAVPPTLSGYEARDPYPFDPGAARELLASQGFPDGFEMEIWLRDSPEGNRILEAVQGYLAEVGVEARLVRREWSAFKEAVGAGKVDAFFLDWVADYPDAENFIYPLFHSKNSGGGGNRAMFNEPDIDRLIEEAGRTPDQQLVGEMYARIDAEIYERAPWIYMYHPVAFQAVSPGITGYRMPVVYLGADYTTVSKHAE